MAFQEEAESKYNSRLVEPAVKKAHQSWRALDNSFVAGSPKTVADKIAALRDIGVRNLILNVCTGDFTTERVEHSMRLFGEKVMPLFREKKPLAV